MKNKINKSIIILIAFSQLGFSQIVNENRLKAHLKFLSSDELEGRETSFHGEKIAAKYIASHFEKIGLKNLDSNFSFLQHFPLVHTLISENSNITIHKNNKSEIVNKFGKDFLPIYVPNDTIIKSEVVFAGFGINYKNKINDYDTNFNYKNKIVLVFRGSSFDSTVNFILQKRLSSSFAKKVYASAFGASAIIIIDEDENHKFEDSYNENLNNLLKGTIHPDNFTTKDIPIILISKTFASNLLQNINIDSLKNSLKKSKPLNFINNLSITLNLKLKKKNVSGENVAGLHTGSDPILKNEYIIVSSHFDHVGKNLVTNEIFNGADDDASGTTSLLELAEIFSSKITKRSILFLTFSGEEKGLLGSNHYVKNPLIPLDKSITNINIDMVGRVDPKYDSLKNNKYIYVIGSDKLSLELDLILKNSNKKSSKLFLDYTYNDDNDPNQFYKRSDHYNFAKNNIPVIFFFNGTHEDYHKESDEYEKIDFVALKNRTELIYQTIFELANAQKRPKLKNDAERK